MNGNAEMSQEPVETTIRSETASEDESDTPLHLRQVPIEEILAARHPFEEANYYCEKPLSVVQKAITYVIIKNGGYAKDQDILQFLHTNWETISSNSSHIYQTVPNQRILNINFSITKGKKYLFAAHPTEPNTWGLGDPSIRSGRTKTTPPPNFEYVMSRIISTKPDGISSDALAQSMKSHEGSPGLFAGTPLKMRLHSCLAARRADGKIEYDEMLEVWKPVPKSEQCSRRNQRPRGLDNCPDCLKGILLHTISVDELYDILKANGIYP